MRFDRVIQGGTLITPEQVVQADLGITDGLIAAIDRGLSGDEVIDARGKLVVPGGVDPHVHLDVPVGAFRACDDWRSGTTAALCGGTTTVIDFVEPDPGESLLEALAKRRAQAEGSAVIDFGLHMTLRDDRPETLAQIPAVIAAGCPSFKTYLAYEGFALSDAAFLNVLEAVHTQEGLVLVHAEINALIEHLTRRLLAAGQTAPRFHAQAHASICETEAIRRAIALAELTYAPLYVVHVSTAEGAQAIHQARQRSLPVYGETCPQYLLLNDRAYESPDAIGARFVCSPPLRSAADNEGLWQALSQGILQTVGTDHCPFNSAEKESGLDRFTDIPSGLPGIESRLALLYTYGVGAGRLSLQQWVALCATTPARLFGLYPQKGVLVPGADADVVIFDPEKTVRLSKMRLHERVDYTPYEGFTLHGYPVQVYRRGELAVKDNQTIGPVGTGRFLPRHRWNHDPLH